MLSSILVSALVVASANPSIPSDSLRATIQSRAVATVSWQGAISGTADRGVTWPERSTRQYVFGGGLWLAGPGMDASGPSVVMAYNPLTGRSWMRPGTSQNLDLPDQTLRQQFGVRQGADADLALIREGLAADHHSVAEYTASTKAYYDPSSWTFTTSPGALNLDVKQHTFGWTTGILKDAVLLVYEIRNSGHTALGPVYSGFMVDPDLVDALLPTKGVADDMLTYTTPDAALRMIRASSADAINGEMGVVLIEGPTRSSDGTPVEDLVLPERQGAINSIHLLNNTRGMLTNAQRYSLMADPKMKTDTVRGDVSAILSTSGMVLKPGQTIRLAVAIVFGKSKSGVVAEAPDATDPSTVAKAVYDAYYAKASTTDVVAGSEVIEEYIPLYNMRRGEVEIHVGNCTAGSLVELINIEGAVVGSAKTSPNATTCTFQTGSIARGLYFMRTNCGGTYTTQTVAIE